MPKRVADADRVWKARAPLRLSDGDYDRLRRAAFDEQRPMSEIVRDGLKLYFEANPPKRQRARKPAPAAA